ncbi:MAG: WcaF family extracellular polysaccharide biosynthesis acetyltransferase [Candidatus Altiarchaeota archaeon]|nr:WcaF family extracellular polysaccharide biosynthesis acetyltransferase [Candidatus Altiarchaeota archaeon]
MKLEKYSRPKSDKCGNIRFILWYLVNCVFFKSSLPLPCRVRIFLLRLFGAKIGRSLFIQHSVNIKYPWRLEVGDNVWIGENVWIDNLDWVRIGSNSCISQGACVFTGNHDYKKETFDFFSKPVTIEESVWVGAKSIICPGAVLKSHSVLCIGSVVKKDTESNMVYSGNPAKPIRKRY